MLGETLRLNAEPYTVVGVLPASFWFPGEPQPMVPFAWRDRDLSEMRGSRRLEAFARIRPGIARSAAEGELKRIFARLEEQYPESNDGWSVQTFTVQTGCLDSTDARSGSSPVPCCWCS